ncbi:beta-glucosidase [Diplodia corticola]|uniref:beta-glucosidase n=1 Tax=Diplodia corticola TaxID=236234 RepID=A0A1J9RQQ1_9PEZI|nr:beta-glucosidase [Diplodia corticola]OJD30775.1 beta-glucosidase [Diplodia corticola]
MAPIDIDDALSKLDVSEKVELLSGIDFWHTKPIPRLGIPSIRTSDGPNGVRGTRFFNGVPAACFPCGTALAATWDLGLIEAGGTLMGREAIAKGAHVILGPTTNMQRSPLGGRGFESFSEDPHLAGMMSAATVRGIQETGVAATIKHFVCNDQEHERQAVDSIVTERALREIYLMPFQIAQRDAKPAAYMTAYNRVNGCHMSDNKEILQGILRDEWGFEGMVMSDWFGTYTSADSVNAGLDLEMPGPPRVRGKQTLIAHSVRSISDETIDARVRKVLELVNRVDKLNIPENAPEKTIDTPETAAALRRLGAASIVLMKNENGVLPFRKDKSLAVIGPNAKMAAYAGGGSANLLPYYAVTPYDGIRAQKEDVKYALGAVGYRSLPVLSHLTKTKKDGNPGLTAKFFTAPPTDAGRKPVDEVAVEASDILLSDYKHPAITSDTFWMDLEGTLTPETSGEYIFGVSVCGTAKLFVGGELVVDNTENQRQGDTFFGSGTVEETGTMKLEAGKTYDVYLQFGSSTTSNMKTPGATVMAGGGVRVGGTLVTEPQAEIDKAVQLAKEVDQVVIIAGLNGDWESEGYDRRHMSLPGHTDALIAAVCAANPSTAIVLQSGTPVAMPWLDAAPALLHAWYGGNETGNAIADVVFGGANPSAKLPLTFPVRNEDNPAFLNYRSDRGRALYGEDVYVGYRFYDKTRRAVLFPFGHGLSYTSFAFAPHSLHIDDPADPADPTNATITLSITVRNTGPVPGAQVVQVFVAPRSSTSTIGRPVKELKGFAKTSSLPPGAEERVAVQMRKKYAAAYWDELRRAWCVERGVYDVLVGDISGGGGGGGGDGEEVRGEFEVGETFWWRGL